MNEYLEDKINSLQSEIEYYIGIIEETRLKRETSNNPASINYYDRKIYYAEYNLFRLQAEQDRLKSKIASRILK